MEFRAILTKIRSLLAMLAPVTPIKLDDALVVLIDAALADANVFGWLKAKAEQPAGTLSLEAEPPVALQQTLELRGLKWGQVLAMLPQILEIIRLFSQQG